MIFWELIFLLEVFINFFRAEKDDFKETRVRIVAKRYLFTWFAVDFIGVLALEMLWTMLIFTHVGKVRQIFRGANRIKQSVEEV